MKDIINQWNNAALKYTKEQECSEFAESNKSVVKARFKHFNGEKVLDIGCGYGVYTDYFRNIGANVIGIDGSEKMIEIARARYPVTRFLVMDILYYSIVHPAFYDCHWQKDENGYRYAKIMDKYIKSYQITNEFWGETEHFHRPLSYYLNETAKNGFTLKQTWEPVSYDGINKNSDLPLFFFAEYIKEE